VVGVLFIRDVGAVAIAEFLCEAEIDNVDEVGALAGAHNEVGGFYVTVNKIVRVDEFNAG
jgi:hypothetical protein